MSSHKFIPWDRTYVYGSSGREIETQKMREQLKKYKLPKGVKEQILEKGDLYHKVRFEVVPIDPSDPEELNISVPQAASILGTTADKLRRLYDRGEIEMHKSTYANLISIDELARLYDLKTKGEL